MANSRRYSLTSCLDFVPITHNPVQSGQDTQDEPPPELLVGTDPNDSNGPNAARIRGDRIGSETSSTPSPIRPTIPLHSEFFPSSAPVHRETPVNTPVTEVTPTSAPSTPRRAHQHLNRQILTQDALESCHTQVACPATEVPRQSPYPSPNKQRATQPRRASSPKPYTTLAEDTKRLLAYQRSESSSCQYQSSDSSPLIQSFPTETTITTILNQQATMHPSLSSSSSQIDTRFIHQLHPTALNALLDENIDPNHAPKWLIFTTYGTPLSFSSSVPTKQARAVAALVGLTWRSIEGENSEPVNVAKHHVKATLHPIYEHGVLQSAVFEVYGVLAAVSMIKEKLLVAAMCDSNTIHSDNTTRRQTKNAIIEEQYPNEVARLRELGVDDVERVPGFAPAEARELASKILEEGEKAMKKDLGLGRLRVLELKAEAMAEQIAEQVEGLKVPDGVY